jgi:outer membrane biosynthesis protein TonB
VAKIFWRNVVVISLAHVALILGLIRWSTAARASSNPDSVIWLENAADLAAGQSEDTPSSPTGQVTPAPEPLKHGEPEKEKPDSITAKSEIELPSATPKPTVTPAPRPTVKVTPHPKPTPKPVRQPTPKKTVVAKASPKPSPKTKPRLTKASDKLEETNKGALAKNESQSQSGNGKSDSTGKNGSAGGGSNASEFGWYADMLHDRFYHAWIQPTTNVAGTKISTLVKLRIEKDGRVSKFEIIKPSANVAIDESVRVVAKQVTQVDPPPTGLFKGDHYDVKINFELNTEEKTGN